MRILRHRFTMVPIVSFLAALRILTEAQSCNNGEGKVVFERISSFQLQPTPLSAGLPSIELFQTNETPLKAAEECRRRCQQNKLSQLSSCTSFDVVFGQRASSPFELPAKDGSVAAQHMVNSPNAGQALPATAHYQPTDCILHGPPNVAALSSGAVAEAGTANANVAVGALNPIVNGAHFSPTCLPTKALGACAEQLYAFDRLPGLAWTSNPTPAHSFASHSAANVSACEHLCLVNPTSDTKPFVCRSASFDTTSGICTLSSFTRQQKPQLVRPLVGGEYVENACLSPADACPMHLWLMQSGRELLSVFERQLVVAGDLNDCAAACTRSSSSFTCTAFSFDSAARTCALYDQVGTLDTDWPANVQRHSSANLYTRVCLIEKDEQQWNDSVIEVYRQKRLEGPHEVESVTESAVICMQECAKRFALACRMFEYSAKDQMCRFSSDFVQQRALISGASHLLQDAQFDFYHVISYPQTMEPVLHGQRQSMTSNNVGHPSSQSYLANNQVYNTNSGTPMNHHRGGYGYERHQALLNPPPYAAGSGSPLTHQLPLPMIHANSRNVYAGNALTGAHGYPQNYASSLAANSMHQSMLSALQHSPPNPLQASLTPSSASSNLDLISAQHQLNAHQLSHAMSNSPVDMSNSLFSAPNYGSISQRSQASAYQNMLYPSSANNVPSNSIPAAGSSITVSSASSNTNSASSSSGAVGAGGTSFSLDRCKYPLSLTAASNQQLSLVSSTGTARFAKIGFGTRLKSNYIFKVLQAARLEDCERACVESRDFMCRSFNYRAFFPAENCELSHYDSRQLRLDSGQFFEQHTQFDYYERDSSSVGPTNGAGAGGMLALASSPTATVNMADCVEVSQSCSPDGMEFTLRTPEKFFGRIYTYGFYDSCFFDGNGGNVNVLKISRANGFPRCGTQQYGDAMTNIVVVQFNDYVQTSRDKKYNLTCYFSGPGEAVVTSNYLDTKTDPRHPMQIENLPAQNILTSNVVLRILYRGSPTNVIGVGDLLTFRLESRSQYRYDLYNSDIFATNVIAKDPYTGRQVQLIDSRGCPSDLYVFPELHKTPDGALEAEFYAFKLPDSNFLVFQATVRTCRGPCEPVICSDSGRGQGSFPSWGRRRRRSVNDTETLIATESQTDEAIEVLQAVESKSNPLLAHISPAAEQLVPSDSNSSKEKPVEDPEEVHELLRVYSSRSQIPKAQALHAGSELDEEDQRPEDDAEAETTELKSKQSKSIESDVNRFGALFETAPKHLQQSGQQLNLQPMIGSVCVTATHYYSLLTGLLLFLLLFLLMLGSFTLVFRQGARHKLRSLESIPSQLSTRNSCADSSTDHSPHHSLRSDIRLHLPFHKPNRTGNFRLGHESLYSPPPQSEKSRSLRSLTVEQLT